MENERQQKIDAMRRVCAFMESYPDFVLPTAFDGALLAFVNGKEEFAAHVRMLGSGAKSADETFFRFTKDIGAGIAIQIADWRNTICDALTIC